MEKCWWYFSWCVHNEQRPLFSASTYLSFLYRCNRCNFHFSSHDFSSINRWTGVIQIMHPLYIIYYFFCQKAIKKLFHIWRCGIIINVNKIFSAKFLPTLYEKKENPFPNVRSWTWFGKTKAKCNKWSHFMQFFCWVIWR